MNQLQANKQEAELTATQKKQAADAAEQAAQLAKDTLEQTEKSVKVFEEDVHSQRSQRTKNKMQ